MNPQTLKTSLTPNNFDLIRLMAACQVVLVHGAEHLGLKSSNEYLLRLWSLLISFPGVPVFFVISGFLISRSLERRPSRRAYAVNRICRIYPALVVCFAVSVFSVFVIAKEIMLSASPGGFFSWMLAQLTIAQFYNPEFLRSYGVGVLNGSLWTIPVELQFYVALPVLYRLSGFRTALRNPVLLAIILIFVVLNQLIIRNESHLPAILQKLLMVTFIPYFWLFLVGVLAQRNWEQIRPIFENRFTWWFVGYLVLILICSDLGFDVSGNDQFPLVALALAGLVLAAAFSWRNISESTLNGNDISYGIYIYHMVVINALVHRGFSGSVSSLALTIFLTSVLASLSWVFVERPALGRSRRSAVTQKSMHETSPTKPA